jgi:protein TonB
MASYRGNQKQDRAKALAAVALVHAALGAIILTGLDVRIVGQTVERLQTFDITPEAPPPPIPEPPPPPRPEESSAPEEEAAPANIKSRPTPVVAPRPPIPLPIARPVNSSNVRGPEGLDRMAGASNRPGLGTGAGGQGSGFGGGGRGGTGAGAGSGAGFTPAQRISKIPDSQYRRIVAATGQRTGSVGVTLKVNVDGRPSNCRIARSSGNPTADALMCELAIGYMRWRPARDPDGRPVPQDVTWYPDWAPNR